MKTVHTFPVPRDMGTDFQLPCVLSEEFVGLSGDHFVVLRRADRPSLRDTPSPFARSVLVQLRRVQGTSVDSCSQFLGQLPDGTFVFVS